MGTGLGSFPWTGSTGAVCVWESCRGQSVQASAPTRRVEPCGIDSGSVQANVPLTTSVPPQKLLVAAGFWLAGA